MHTLAAIPVYYFHPDHLGSSSYVTGRDGKVTQHMEYLPFGETLTDEHINSKNSPFKYNGKEYDEETGNYYYGARYYDPKLSIFMSVDPLVEKTGDAYAYCYNNPINMTDPTGMEGEGDYYTKAGKYLGWDGKNDGKVYLVNEGDYKNTGKGKNTVSKSTELKGISNKTLLAFASLIHAESGGDRDESYAIGNVTTNFLTEGGSSQLKTIEDVSLYDNTFAQGATQENFSNFLSLDQDDRNSKYAIGAAINAYGNYLGMEGFSDYSNGADGWDGTDLIQSSFPGGNNHRNYSWSSNSKSLLSTYKKDNNGGVNVAGFSYKSSGFQISATKIIGKTLFTNLNTGRGERKQSRNSFTHK